MMLQNKTFLSIALSMSLLFGSVMPALGARRTSVRMAASQKTPVVAPLESRSDSSAAQETTDAAKPTKKKLSWRATINQKFNNLKERISNFFHDNPEATVASVAVVSAACTGLALWLLWDNFAAPVNHNYANNPAAPQPQPAVNQNVQAEDRRAQPNANAGQANNPVGANAQPVADPAHVHGPHCAHHAQPLANPAHENNQAVPEVQPVANQNPSPVANPNANPATNQNPRAGSPAAEQPAPNQRPPLPPVPWVPTQNVIANSACDVLELPLAQDYRLQLARQVGNAIQGYEERNVEFRLNVPTRIVQIRCADQQGPECGYHAIKNSMVLLNELANPQGNLQERLADDALCQQVFGFNPDQGHGVWRQRILAERLVRVGIDANFAQQLNRIQDIGRQIRANNMRIDDLQDLIQIEQDEQIRGDLLAEQLELRNQYFPLNNERVQLNLEVRQRDNMANPGLGLDESDRHGDWLRAGALQHIINHERRQPADNALQLLQDFNTPITVIDQLEQVGSGLVGIDPTLVARARFAEARPYRHAFVVTTARVVNGRPRGGHYFAAVLDRNADGVVRWYVADSMNRPILNSLALRNLIMAVQGEVQA